MKSTFDNLYRFDGDKAVNGIPFPVGTNAKNEEVIFFIAKAGNPDHERAQRKRSKQLELTRSKKARAKIMCEIVAEGILKNWTGVLDKDGGIVEPTLENKASALDKYDQLFTDVMSIASNSMLYLDDNDDDDNDPDDLTTPAEETEKN